LKDITFRIIPDLTDKGTYHLLVLNNFSLDIAEYTQQCGAYTILFLKAHLSVFGNG